MMDAHIDVSNVRIETIRLILRPWRETDLQDFYEYARVDGVGQMAGWLPHESLVRTKKILEQFISHKKVLALELKENHKVIGSLGIEELGNVEEIPNALRGRELGYVLCKAYWGRGLMPEAVQSVMDYCFQTLGLDFLTCAHFVRNTQSRRVIEKCGFHYLKDIDYKTCMGTHEHSQLYIRFRPYEDKSAPEGVDKLAELTLETERLFLRGFRDEDAADCFAFLSDRQTCHLDGGYEPFSEMDWQYWWLMEKFKAQRGRFMVVVKNTGKIIGTINLLPVKNRVIETLELGYVISPAYRRNGYALEGVGALISCLFRELDTKMFVAAAAEGNTPSLRLLEKLGFTYEGNIHKGFYQPEYGPVELKSYYLEK